MTLDEWVGKNAIGLGASISVHISEIVKISHEDKEMLLRCIMTSIRQWEENKNDEK